MSLYFSIVDTSSCMLGFQITPSPKTRKEKKGIKKQIFPTYFVTDIFVADQVEWAVAQ